MDISYESAYVPESYSKSFMRVCLVCFVIILVFVLLYMNYQNNPRRSVVIQKSPFADSRMMAKVKNIILCFNKNLQLENLNLMLYGDPYDQLFNVPINPNLRETGIDGTMAKKHIVGSKVMYKVSLPIPVSVREVVLDMGVNSPENLFIFLEDADENRIWERNISMGPGRYHKVDIRDKDIYIWT